MQVKVLYFDKKKPLECIQIKKNINKKNKIFIEDVILKTGNRIKF